ncbi:MAG: hypothetical protein ACJA1I_000904, partial [Zhongshania marina]
YGAAALPSTPNSLQLAPSSIALGTVSPIVAAVPQVNLRPPTRAPPLHPLV